MQLFINKKFISFVAVTVINLIYLICLLLISIFTNAFHRILNELLLLSVCSALHL